MYLEGKANFRNICNENKKILEKRISDELIKSKNDPKLFWKNVKKMSGFHKPVSNSIKPVEWSYHFRKLLNMPAEIDGNFESFVLENLREHDVNCENCLGNVNGHKSDLNLLNDKTTIDEISKAINKMKSNKGPGFDGVTIEFIKEAKFFFLPMLEKLFDHIVFDHKLFDHCRFVSIQRNGVRRYCALCIRRVAKLTLLIIVVFP